MEKPLGAGKEVRNKLPVSSVGRRGWWGWAATCREKGKRKIDVVLAFRVTSWTTGKKQPKMNGKRKERCRNKGEKIRGSHFFFKSFRGKNRGHRECVRRQIRVR